MEIYWNSVKLTFYYEAYFIKINKDFEKWNFEKCLWIYVYEGLIRT